MEYNGFAADWDQGDGIKALIRSDTTVTLDRLADPSVPLADLA